jgi:hypothetical protein
MILQSLALESSVQFGREHLEERSGTSGTGDDGCHVDMNATDLIWEIWEGSHDMVASMEAVWSSGAEDSPPRLPPPPTSTISTSFTVVVKHSLDAVIAVFGSSRTSFLQEEWKGSLSYIYL